MKSLKFTINYICDGFGDMQMILVKKNYYQFKKLEDSSGILVRQHASVTLIGMGQNAAQNVQMLMNIMVSQAEIFLISHQYPPFTYDL